MEVPIGILVLTAVVCKGTESVYFMNVGCQVLFDHKVYKEGQEAKKERCASAVIVCCNMLSL